MRYYRDPAKPKKAARPARFNPNHDKAPARPISTGDVRAAMAPPHRNRKASRMTGAQRNGEGHRSEWAQSTSYFDARERDARWSRTVSN